LFSEVLILAKESIGRQGCWYHGCGVVQTHDPLIPRRRSLWTNNLTIYREPTHYGSVNNLFITLFTVLYSIGFVLLCRVILEFPFWKDNAPQPLWPCSFLQCKRLTRVNVLYNRVCNDKDLFNQTPLLFWFNRFTILVFFLKTIQNSDQFDCDDKPCHW